MRRRRMQPVAGGTAGRAAAAAEAVARRSYGRLVALIASRSGDVARAEDALADAFAVALATWPTAGVPENPEAWLLVTARRRFVDGGRRAQTRVAAEPHLALLAAEIAEATGAEAEIPDRRLALMFVCAHPAIAAPVRAPLILQSLLGFDAATIASAFLVSPAAMEQRLARAKTKIREAAVPFHVPDRADLPNRLDAVLSAVYAAYAEGWTDAGGTDGRRRNLAGEAIWLARLVHRLLPAEPEAAGLLALMLHAEARRPARRDAGGAFVPLSRQNVALWDHALIAEAEMLLAGASRSTAIGRFQIEAAIQSLHADRRTTGRTDWPALVTLYDALWAITGSPIVAVNRAAARAEAGQPEAALGDLDALAADNRMRGYQPFWAARAAVLARTGDRAGADAAYGLAIGLEPDEAVRAHLAKQRSSLHATGTPDP